MFRVLDLNLLWKLQTDRIITVRGYDVGGYFFFYFINNSYFTVDNCLVQYVCSIYFSVEQVGPLIQRSLKESWLLTTKCSINDLVDCVPILHFTHSRQYHPTDFVLVLQIIIALEVPCMLLMDSKVDMSPTHYIQWEYYGLPPINHHNWLHLQVGVHVILIDLTDRYNLYSYINGD